VVADAGVLELAFVAEALEGFEGGVDQRASVACGLKLRMPAGGTE
jgi:hypothetical protein